MIEQVEQDNSQQKQEKLETNKQNIWKKNSKKGMIKGDNKEDRISNWYEYFCNILEKDSILVDQLLENNDNILTQTEISNELLHKLKLITLNIT